MALHHWKSAALRALVAVAFLHLAVQAAPAVAQSADPNQATDPNQEIWNKIVALPWVVGPQDVAALEGATLSLKADYVFLDVPSVTEFMNLTQNPRDGTEREQIFGPADLRWFGIIEFIGDGYIEDKEEIDADALLEAMRTATEEANEVRRKNGWAEMTIVGWRRTPNYDPQTNRLEWAIDANNSDGTSSTNFNTRILGRRGATSAVLVTDPQHFEADLAEFKLALAGYDFNPGERYSEFQEGDKVAAYGLGALVLGGAAAVAAKTGLWKTFGKFIWIAVVAAGAVIWGFFKKLFGGRKAS